MLPANLTEEALIASGILGNKKTERGEARHFNVIIPASHYAVTADKNKLWQLIVRDISACYSQFVISLPYVMFVPDFAAMLFEEMTPDDIHIRLFGEVSFKGVPYYAEPAVHVSSNFTLADIKKDINQIWGRVVKDVKVASYRDCPKEYDWFFSEIADIKTVNALRGMGWVIKASSRVLYLLQSATNATGVYGMSVSQEGMEVLADSTWACNVALSDVLQARIVFSPTNPRTGVKGEDWFPTVSLLIRNTVYRRSYNAVFNLNGVGYSYELPMGFCTFKDYMKELRRQNAADNAYQRNSK